MRFLIPRRRVTHPQLSIIVVSEGQHPPTRALDKEVEKGTIVGQTVQRQGVGATSRDGRHRQCSTHQRRCPPDSNRSLQMRFRIPVRRVARSQLPVTVVSEGQHPPARAL